MDYKVLIVLPYLDHQPHGVIVTASEPAGGGLQRSFAAQGKEIVFSPPEPAGLNDARPAVFGKGRPRTALHFGPDAPTISEIFFSRRMRSFEGGRAGSGAPEKNKWYFWPIA